MTYNVLSGTLSLYTTTSVSLDREVPVSQILKVVRSGVPVWTVDYPWWRPECSCCCCNL